MKKIHMVLALSLFATASATAFARPVECGEFVCSCDNEDEQCLDDLSALCERFQGEMDCDDVGCYCEF